MQELKLKKILEKGNRQLTLWPWVRQRVMGYKKYKSKEKADKWTSSKLQFLPFEAHTHPNNTTYDYIQNKQSSYNSTIKNKTI